MGAAGLEDHAQGLEASRAPAAMEQETFMDRTSDTADTVGAEAPMEGVAEPEYRQEEIATRRTRADVVESGASTGGITEPELQKTSAVPVAAPVAPLSTSEIVGNYSDGAEEPPS